MGIMVKALAISLRSENSTFAPSGWFMHTWSHSFAVALVPGLPHLGACSNFA